ncbi:MAG: SulP family inorganic anion transporter [Aquificota bacterium]|nr:SulP family inorganic anion transporter [Aquificota bacterium]
MNTAGFLAKAPLPFFRWFRDYSKDSFIRDLIAGITVAAVYVPQAMAYALLAGMPPITGLYTAFIATIVAAIFGSSRFLGTGPVAMTCLLSASVLYGLNLEPRDGHVGSLHGATCPHGRCS